MGDRQQLTLAADVSSLPTGRAFIAAACQNLSLDEDLTYDILLAVDEVLSNIIEHGYAGLEPGQFILAWYVEDSRFVLQITDFGHVFEPSKPEEPNIEAIFEGGGKGGFGLYLVYNIMDEISYQPAAEGNTLTMVKNLKQD